MHRDVLDSHWDLLAGSGLSLPEQIETRNARPRRNSASASAKRGLYDQAREFVDQGKYDRAIERFTDVISMKGARADAALYWKAYAQNRAGQRPEALTTIATLSRTTPRAGT